MKPKLAGKEQQGIYAEALKQPFKYTVAQIYSYIKNDIHTKNYYEDADEDQNKDKKKDGDNIKDNEVNDGNNKK